MASMTHLLDKSAWAQAQYSPDAVKLLANLMRRGELALCTMTVMEILFSARNTAEYNRDLDHLDRLPWRDLSEPRRAAKLQHALAQRGWHRTPLPDVIVAATAAEHDLIVLHYDSDYERLSEVAGMRQQWIIPASG
ncbi:MAG: PIN domain-containing protein [Pseudonocardiales bacterium]